jgi:hypothetical protein
MDLPEDRLVEKKKVVELFATTQSSLNAWLYKGSATAGKLEIEPDGKIDLLKAANYIMRRSRKGRGQKQLMGIAQQIKNHYKKPDDSKKLNTKKSEHLGEKGIEHALARIQDTEVQLAQIVQDNKDDPNALANDLRNWNNILEILRRTEVDALKVMEEKRQLIRLDEAKALYDKGILPVKTRLMALPVQLASQLEDQDAPTIQKMLERAIAKTLTDISEVWEKEDDLN